LAAWPIEVRCAHRDLARTGLLELLAAADLVTASALFDLVSRSWADALIAAASHARAALLAVLSYDGRIGWTPADPFDPRIRQLLNRHQRTDKGFGPALGPEAARWLERQARRAGAVVISRSSDWRLNGGQAALQRALLPGLVAAARAIAPAEEGAIDGWLKDRLATVEADGSALRVGHRDLFAAW
jgi:hypothetical protein